MKFKLASVMLLSGPESDFVAGGLALMTASASAEDSRGIRGGLRGLELTRAAFQEQITAALGKKAAPGKIQPLSAPVMRRWNLRGLELTRAVFQEQAEAIFRSTR